MRYTLLILTTLAAAGFSEGLPAEFCVNAAGAPMTAAERKSLDEGGILVYLRDAEDSPVQEAVTSAVFDATPEVVFEALSNFENHPHFMPYVKEITQTEEDGAWRVRQVLDLPWPVGNRSFSLRVTKETRKAEDAEVRVARWEYVAGSGNIGGMGGSYEVVACGEGKALLRYTCFMDPGGKIPKWMVNMSTKDGAADVVKDMREFVAARAAEARKVSAAR